VIRWPILEGSMHRQLLVASAVLVVSSIGLGGQAKRPLAIEDYYRVLTIANPQISPDGKTVRFSVQTRLQSDNGTKTEVFTVPTDASASPVKVEDAPAPGPATGSGQAGRGGRGAARVTSPDGQWVVRTQEKPRPRTDPKYASDFEK